MAKLADDAVILILEAISTIKYICNEVSFS